jgi:hypothetical protein
MVVEAVMWTVPPEGEGLGVVRLGRVDTLQLGARDARLDFRLDVLEAGWGKIEEWVAGLGLVVPPPADRRHLRRA